MASGERKVKAEQARGLASEPLRKEAERRWAEADRVASQGAKRTQARARARAKRGEVAKAKDEEIASLKGKLERAEQAVSQHPRPRRKDASGK